MKKKVLLLMTALLVGGACAMFAVNKTANTTIANAATCEHKVVEHYEAKMPTHTEKGYVEHYACCECHTAWSDEALTQVIGSTYTDRSAIDLPVIVEHNKRNTTYVPETETHKEHYYCADCDKRFSFEDVVVPVGGFFDETAPYANWQGQNQKVIYDDEVDSMVLNLRKTTSDHAALTYKRIGSLIATPGKYTLDFDIKQGSAVNGGMWIQFGNCPAPFDMFGADEVTLDSVAPVNKWTHIQREFTVNEGNNPWDNANIELIIWCNATNWQDENCFINIDNIVLRNEAGTNVDERGNGNLEALTVRTLEQLAK